MVATANDSSGSWNDPAELFVATEELAQATGRYGGLVDQLSAVQSKLAALKLAKGALGPSTEADGVIKYWNEALDQRIADVKVCLTNTGQMGDDLERSVRNYIAAEDANTRKVRDKAGDKAQDNVNEQGQDAREEGANARHQELRDPGYAERPGR